MKPLWEELEKENPWLETEYFDIDDNPDLEKKYDLKKYPTFIFLDKEGEEIERLEGEHRQEELVEIINRLKDR
jgi:thioredoxin-related protein